MSLFAMTRRDFLRNSGVAAGGLALGVTLPRTGRGAEATTELNAFVHIGEDGATTIYCGRCEMGQGISTALPAAVADELEADWERVRVLQGDADEKFGPQNTGGSRSINIMFEPMREAGAAAQAMLVAAAAARWGIDSSQCYAENHFVRNRLNDRRLAYGELAADAAKQPVPEKVTLKTRDQFRYIGQPIPRHDFGLVVRGERRFGADVRLPGMKYAAIRHVPVMGGSVKRWDAAKAKQMPGVIEVVHIPRFENPYGSLGGIAVVAEDSWTAEQALRTVEIEWDRGPHGDYDTQAYKQMLVRNVEQEAETVFERGDLAAAFDGARQRHSATYVGSHLSHSPMEPMASTVWVRDDGVEVWASTQDPRGIQRTLAAYLDLEPGDITVHVMISGGAFGRKFKCDYVQEAAALSKAVGAPVHLTWSRREDTRTGYYHSVSAQHLEASLDAEGRVTGWLHRAAFPPIGSLFDASVERPSASDLEDVSQHPFGIPNTRVESGHAPAHTRIGWYRAVYALFYGFAFGSFADELAHTAGVDTVEFLRRIYRGNQDPEQAEKVRRSLGVLELAARKGGWGREMPPGHGLGIAVHYSFESYAAMLVHAEVDGDDIRVHRVDCAVDCGLVLNPDQARAQMEGAVAMGMSLALHTEISFENGAVVNRNYNDYPILEIDEMPPEVNVHFVESDAKPTGLGEPGVPTLAPALANAIFAASGKRHRSLPIKPRRA
jgi:isoquinoline 1-oxidoreductase beta subunit